MRVIALFGLSRRVGAALLVCAGAASAACAPDVPDWSADDHALVASGPDDNPFVHTDGTRLVDGDGQTVKLRGANLGGWLQWEGWMFGGGWSLDGESKMLARLADVVGTEAADQFREDVRARFITEEDIRLIADSGANVVRVGFNHELLEDLEAGGPREEGYAVIDELLLWCEAHGVYVVLDMHCAPGGQSPFWQADPDDTERLWDSPVRQDRTVAIWEEIARRYRDREIIAGYDLLNEPAPPDGATLLAFYQRLAEAIRAIDPLHLILLEGTSAASDMKMFTEAVTWNQAYTVHQYEFFGDWRVDELKRWTAVSEAHNVPLWIGEFGLSDADDIRASVDLYDEDDDIAGFALWSWKEAVDEDDMALIIKDAPDEWFEVARTMNGAWGKPSKEDAERGIAGFLDALDPSQCTSLDGVIDAIGAR